MMSCRDMMKVGQLILNGGQWPASDGTMATLVDAQYIHEMMTPALPEVSVSYGYLTWLNAPPRPPATALCCRSRWCSVGRWQPDKLEHSVLGVGTEADWADLGVAFGWLGMYMFASPSKNLVVVSFGRTYGSSSDCSIAGGSGISLNSIEPNYADDFTAGAVWHTVGPALVAARPSLPSSSPPQPPPAPIAPGPPPVAAGRGGSCTCYCPPDQGFGQCFPAASKEECTGSNLPVAFGGSAGRLADSAARQCAAVAVVQQCPFSGECKDMTLVHGGFSGCQGGLLKADCMDCGLQVQACPDTATFGPFDAAACSCTVTRFMSCSYDAHAPCPARDPYMNAAGECGEALDAACLPARTDAFACAQCAGGSLGELQQAGCNNNQISAWCAGKAV
jgi:hypothetical protein